MLNQQYKGPVKGIQTDTSDNFALENVPAGTYALRVSYLGYNDIFKENKVINTTTGNLILGTLLMIASKNKMLKEVVISAKKHALQNIDGKRFFQLTRAW